MTDDQLKRLMAMEKKVDAIHRRLMEKPREDTPPLIARLEDMLDLFEKSNWSVKKLVKIVLTLGALGGALVAIKGFSLK